MPVIMPNPVRENKIGKFDIDQRFLEDEPYIVLKVMAKVIIVETIAHYYTRAIGYIGYSNEFEPCENQMNPPHYNIHVNRDGESDKVSFEKVTDDVLVQQLRKITY
jgi:hypothetical protein